jgi:6-phosphogluconolactonase
VDAFSLSMGQLNFLGTADDAEATPPHGLAVDPTSQFVFATDAYETRLTVFGIGAGNSGLNYLEKDLTGANPYSVAVDPTADYVYVTNKSDGTVSAYSYDPAAAAGSILTRLADSPYDVGNGPTGIAINPSGHFLYVTNSADNTVSAFTIDSSTGALTSVGPPVATGNLSGNPSQPMDVKVDPSSQFVYVANYGDNSVSAFKITATTGAVTLTGTVPTGAALALGIE